MQQELSICQIEEKLVFIQIQIRRKPTKKNMKKLEDLRRQHQVVAKRIILERRNQNATKY